MFPSKMPWPIIIQMILVAIVVLSVLFVTSNPLALLGMYFMPGIPVMEEGTDVAPERSNAMGFLADIADNEFDE